MKFHRKTHEFQTGPACSQEECIEPAQCGCHGKLSNLMQRSAILETISPPTRYISRSTRAARDTRPSYPRFQHVKILSEMKLRLGFVRKDGRQRARVGGILSSVTELTRGHVQEFIIPLSVLRRHDDGGAVNILWVDEARVGCSWTVDRYARG